MYKGFTKKTEKPEANKLIRAQQASKKKQSANKQQSETVKPPTKKQKSEPSKRQQGSKVARPKTSKNTKEKVKQHIDWAIRDVKSDLLPTEERQKVQNQIQKEKRAEYKKSGGFANDKAGQFMVGLGKGVIDNSAVGAVYSITKGKKLSDSKVMTKGNKTIKSPTKNAEKARAAGNIAGNMLGYASGYKAVEKGTAKLAGKALASKAGKKATEKAVASKVGKKLGEKATKKIVNSAAKDIAADATIGTALDLGLARGEGKKGKELARDMAENAALNAVTGGIVEGVSGAKALINAKKAAKGAKNVAEVAENVSKKAKNAAENVVDNTGVKLKTEPPKKGAKQAENVKVELPTANGKKAGRVTYIKNPYDGEVPKKSTTSNRKSVEISGKTMDDVEYIVNHSQDKSSLKRELKERFGQTRTVEVKGLSINGQPYAVNLNKKSIGKIVSDGARTDNIAFLSVVDDAMRNADYVGSGSYVPHGSKKKGTVRFDYFESDVKINGKDYVARIDVEAFPDVNNYKTHNIEKIELVPKSAADVGPQPTATDMKSALNQSINDSSNIVNPNLKDLGADVARPNQTIKDAKAKYGSYDGHIPLETNMGRVTQGAKTMYNSPIADKKMRDAIKSGVEDGSYWTRKMSNKDSLRAASEKIRTNGLEDETKSFLNLARDNREVRGEDIAMGYQLANEHIARGNYEAAQSVISDVCQMESEAGRALQAMRLFNSLSPEGRVKSALRSAEKVSKHTGYDVKVSDKMLDALRNATEEELPNIKKEINKELWNQIPASFAEKLTAWRYFAMLGNPRTHIRNIVGNALYVPVVRMDNVIQTGLEKAFSNKLDALGGRKTTAILTGSKSDRELKKFAGEQFDELKKMLDGGNGKYNEEYRPQYARTFKSNAMEGLINFNSNALELEDQMFMKLGYDSAFAQYCKANGKKVSDLTDDFIKEASDYAYNEALRATYRDPSRLADALSKFRKRLDVKATDTMGTKALKTTGKIVMDSALPFTKTPINILKRGVSHSPLGLAKGIAEIATAKDARSLQKAITQIAEGLTGTGVVALGMYMGGKGYANGSLGEYNNEYKWQQLLGKQDYALNVGDYSITMDWAAPICMPFFVGVELGNSMLKENANIWDGIESLSSIYEPVLEMSMLSGVQNLFDFANGESKDIVTFMGNAAQNLGNQFIPTLVGQIARTAVPERKIALSTAENSLQRNVEKYIDKTENKIPGLTNTNQSFVDMFGRTDSKNSPTDYLKAGLENFLSPAYISKRNDGAIETELESLRQSLGSEGKEVLPTDYSSNYDIRYEGKDYRMNEDQFTGYKKERGQDTYRLLGELFSSASYKKMSDSEKRDAIKKVYEQAGEESKRSQVISMGIATERQYDYGTLNKAQKSLVDSGTFTTSEIKKANKLVEKTGATTSAAKAYALANSGMSEKKVAAYTSKNAVETAGKLKMAGATQKDVINCAKIIKDSGAKKSIAKAYALLDGGQKPSIVSALVSDGAVSKASAIKSAGITPEMLDQVAELIDTNGNNHYSNEELYSFLNNFDASRTQKRAIFEALKSSPKTANPY